MGAPEFDATLISQRLADKRAELTELSRLSKEARDPVLLDQQSVGRLSRMDAMQQQAMQLANEQARQRDLVRIDAVYATAITAIARNAANLSHRVDSTSTRWRNAASSVLRPN